MNAYSNGFHIFLRFVLGGVPPCRRKTMSHPSRGGWLLVTPAAWIIQTCKHTFVGRLPLPLLAVCPVKVGEAGPQLEDSLQRRDVELPYWCQRRHKLYVWQHVNNLCLALSDDIPSTSQEGNDTFKTKIFIWTTVGGLAILCTDKVGLLRTEWVAIPIYIY